MAWRTELPDAYFLLTHAQNVVGSTNNKNGKHGMEIQKWGMGIGG